MNVFDLRERVYAIINPVRSSTGCTLAVTGIVSAFSGTTIVGIDDSEAGCNDAVTELNARTTDIRFRLVRPFPKRDADAPTSLDLIHRIDPVYEQCTPLDD